MEKNSRERHKLSKSWIMSQNNSCIKQYQVVMLANLKKIFIGPSILSADFAELGKDCQQVLDLGGDSLHIDIMDGHFVPNLTIGPPVVSWLKRHVPNAHLDCHFMVTYPRHYIEPMSKIGVNCFTFHYQSQHEGLKEICSLIRQKNMEVGLSVKPNTPIDATIQQLIEQKYVDKLLVMTVQPGFGGQQFMPKMIEKVAYLHKKYPDLDIQVDGGIGIENAGLVAQAGANWLVAGSAIFNAKDRKLAIQEIKRKALEGQQIKQ